MTFQRTLEVFELLDSPAASGQAVAEYLLSLGDAEITVTPVSGELGGTDFITVVIPGTDGKRGGGSAPTLGVVGRLGGVGARPEQIGFVSDGDGALASLAAAAKLIRMATLGDRLPGDVIVTTQIDPDAPTQPHEPVPFMGSSTEDAVNNEHEVLPEMDAIVTIDTTKGNRVCNHNGIAITPTIRQGWILRVSEDLLSIAEQVTGVLPAVLPITMQDITPYGNDVYHVNSIVQPAVATSAPVIGLAITTQVMVPGSASGATNIPVVEQAARFSVEVAKGFGRGLTSFFDEADFAELQQRYGSMERLQTLGS